MSRISPTSVFPALIVTSLLLPTFEESKLKGATISRSIKSSIQRRVDYQYTPSISIGIVDRNGRDFYSYGLTSLEGGVLPNEHTLYEIASVSKVLTTTLLAEMVSGGIVSFSDPVGDLLPSEVQVPSREQRPITLEHLAPHTSGLLSNPPSLAENSPLNPFFPYPPETLYEFLGNYQLPRAPGSEFEYSNLGIGLLGHALALQLALSYNDALTERVLLPFGMTETFVPPAVNRQSLRAVGHHGIVPRPHLKTDTFAPAGGLLSSVSDLLTFLEYQLGFHDSPLEDAILQTQRRQVATDSPGLSLGLGWFITQAGSDRIHWHNGASLGQHSFIGFDVRSGKGVAILSNGRLHQYSAVDDLGFKALLPAVPLNSIRRPATLTEQERTRFVGRYVDPDGISVSIGLQHEHLTATSSLNPVSAFTLYPSRGNLFHLYEAITSATLRFTFDADGQPTELLWTQEGEESIYSRVVSPGKLTLTVVDTLPTLSVSGDPSTNYPIETSIDLIHWNALTELRGNESTPIPTAEDTPNRFFRIR